MTLDRHESAESARRAAVVPEATAGGDGDSATTGTPSKRRIGRPRGTPNPNGKVSGSGRKKGTPNKRTAEVQDRLQALGCDPITGMARIAMNRKNPPELRGRMFSELAQYMHPKRKAIEVAGEGAGPFVFQFISGGQQ